MPDFGRCVKWHSPVGQIGGEYTTSGKYWSAQIDEVRWTAGREWETRFYYSGATQAILLDRLLPEWKEWVFDPGVMLEDLLRQAAAQRCMTPNLTACHRPGVSPVANRPQGNSKLCRHPGT